MKLTDYFQSIITEAKQTVAPLSKKSMIDELQKIFPNKKISNSLGINASSIFGLVEFDKKVVVAGLKNNPLVKNAKHILKQDRVNYPNMNSEVFKSSSESFIVTLKNGKVLFFKDTSSTGKKNIRNIASLLSEKELTPDKLGLSGVVHSRADLIKFLNTHKFDPIIKKIIVLITKSISTIRANSDDIDFEIKGLNEQMEKISDADEARIFKDLGEVFSAIVSSGPTDKIFFPKESNFNLIDFIIERQSGKEKSYSAKFNEGAKPSISGVLANIEKNKAILKDDSEEKEVYEILKTINDYSSFEGTEKLSKQFGLEKEVKKEVLMNAKSRELDLKNEKVSNVLYTYIRGKAIKNYLNSEKTSDGSKIVDVFSSLMNASFNIDQVVIKERKGDTLSWKYYDFKKAKFQFEEKNSYEKIISKISFRLNQSSLKK